MSTVRIPLVNSNTLFALVDEEDAESVLCHEWRLHTRYVQSTHNIYGKTMFLHQFILKVGKGEMVDHKDHNGLNNSRLNLREATPTQNTWNRYKSKSSSSQFKGVTFRKWEQRWVASIKHHGKPVFIGWYKTESEAARAFDDKAVELRGEWAMESLNFPGRFKSGPDGITGPLG